MRQAVPRSRKLPSGRWQARYLAPDGTRRSAPQTFDTKRAAENFLAQLRGEVRTGRWVSPDAGAELFASYSVRWLAERTLKPRTEAHYRGILDRHLLPTFGPIRLDGITTAMVKTWHRKLDPGPTMKAHAYGLLRTILGTAVADEAIVRNPCVIRGARTAKRASRTEPVTLAELDAIVAAMPDRLAPIVLLAAWCALRFGELTELRRKDIDLDRGIVDVSRAVVHVNGERIIGTPKSDAGTRKVAIPPHVIPALQQHLDEHVDPGPDSLLFPGVGGAHLATRTLFDVYYPAREAAGRPDLRFHDLRHTGLTLSAATGATLADLMARAGHSTVSAALRYQHAALDRDKAIAEALSEFATAKVVPIGAARNRGRHRA
jgi:integrase